MKNAELHARKESATPRGVNVMCQFYAERALNAELWDVEGRRYIDFGAGIAVLNTGHSHPRITAAIAQQLGQFTHTCYQVVPYQGYVRLAERINAITPGSHPKKTAFFSTGAEAVENAVKVARAATGRSAVVAFHGAFHGRTMMGMALTGKVAPYKTGFGPFPGEVYHALFPVELHGITVDAAMESLCNLFRADVDPKRVAAIIIEPVLGEGGFHQAPAVFMQALRRLCDQHGIILVADEIQTGFGRTGRMFAMDHYDVVPDLMTIAKSLAGGMPLSAVCGKAELMDAPSPGGLGGTYAGNPLAIAAAHAVLDVIEDEGLVARANELGDTLRARLLHLKSVIPNIAEVRGPGAMIAVEFCIPGSYTPDPEFTRKVQAHALNAGLLLLTCGVHGNAIRFLFPLTIEHAVMEEAMQVLEQAIRHCAQPAAHG